MVSETVGMDESAREQQHAADEPVEPEVVGPESSRAVRIGVPAVLFGLVDAALVHQGGRTIGASLVAGVLLGAFIVASLLVVERIRRKRALAQARAGNVPRPGSWANPSRSQRLLDWLRRLRGPGAGGPAHPLDGGKRPRR